MIARVMPRIETVLGGEKAAFSGSDIAAADRLLRRFATHAIPKLRAAVERVRGDLRGGKLDSMFSLMPCTVSASTVGGG